MKITNAIDFIFATGSNPEHDDLDRCNCPHEGEIGHSMCGWCRYHDKPRFVCACTINVRRSKP